jgi:hypothetical protein
MAPRLALVEKMNLPKIVTNTRNSYCPMENDNFKAGLGVGSEDNAKMKFISFIILPSHFISLANL